MLNFIHFLMIIIPVLINVAFVTLLERKILGLAQTRKGPNKVSFIGITQPFADAIKLFFKMNYSPFKSNPNIFYAAPSLAISITLTLWLLIPWKESPLNINNSIVIMIMIMSLNIYPLMLAGWASNSKYSLIGALRGIAQTISYEISLSLIILSIMIIIESTHMHSITLNNTKMLLFPLCAPLMFMWFISCLAETNRTPFDFAEGESELVSGFNIEYGSGGFALIFMAEYGSILFLSMMSSIIIMKSTMMSVEMFINMVLIASIWIWVRGTFPRYRYDKLMNLAWKSLLPLTLFILLFFLSISLLNNF